MKKHLVLQLHFDIDINETALVRDVTDEQYAYYVMQQRLLTAILTHPEALQAYFTYLITSKLDTMSWRKWHALFGINDDDREQALVPALTTLSPNDYAWFEDAQQDEWFYESTEGLDDALTTRITHFNILDVLSDNDRRNETHV